MYVRHRIVRKSGKTHQLLALAGALALRDTLLNPFLHRGTQMVLRPSIGLPEIF